MQQYDDACDERCEQRAAAAAAEARRRVVLVAAVHEAAEAQVGALHAVHVRARRAHLHIRAAVPRRVVAGRPLPNKRGRRRLRLAAWLCSAKRKRKRKKVNLKFEAKKKKKKKKKSDNNCPYEAH